MFFSYGEEMPEEVRQHIEEQRMHGEAHAHDMKDWIEGMSFHDIKVFKSIIFQYSDRPSAAYLVGIINSTMDRKFDICHACGKKHDDITVDDIVPDTLTSAIVESNGVMPVIKKFTEMSGPELLANMHPGIMESMDEYEVDFIEFQWPRVKCANCDAEFASLDDRMKREPGVKGCSNCQQKAKWG